MGSEFNGCVPSNAARRLVSRSNSGARNSTEFQGCIDHINHETFSSDKIDALGACIKQVRVLCRSAKPNKCLV